MKKKVLVTGFFDQLNFGHVRFLEHAAQWGELSVLVGTDENYRRLKGYSPVVGQDERVALIRSLKPVSEAFISSGRGELDFLEDLDRLCPDLFIVSHESHHPDKLHACSSRGIDYKVVGIDDQKELLNCSEQKAVDSLRLPFRICLAGGWLDQPWVSSICPGGVVVINLHPSIEFVDRAGMATSTRKTAQAIWGDRLPSGEPESIARILFGAENPPGTKYVAGSQDCLGLALPGANFLHYGGGFWPESITSDRREETARWLESVIRMVPIGNRPDGYDPLIEQHLEPAYIGMLAQSAEDCWTAIQRRDARLLGKSISATVAAWELMLPNTVPPQIKPHLKRFDHVWGCTLSGCGGGYLILVTEEEIEGSVKIRVRI